MSELDLQDTERRVKRLDSDMSAPRVAAGLGQKARGLARRRTRRRAVSLIGTVGVVLAAGLMGSFLIQTNDVGDPGLATNANVENSEDRALADGGAVAVSDADDPEIRTLLDEFQRLRAEREALRQAYEQWELSRQERARRQIDVVQRLVNEIELDERTAQFMLPARLRQDTNRLSPEERGALNAVVELFPHTVAANEARQWLHSQ